MQPPLCDSKHHKHGVLHVQAVACTYKLHMCYYIVIFITVTITEISHF